MNRLWVIAKREYIAAVFTKAFLFGILFAPAMLVLTILIPQWLEGVGETGERKLAVLDMTGEVSAGLEEASRQHNSGDDVKMKYLVETIDVSDVASLGDDPAAGWEKWESFKAEQAQRVRDEEIFAFIMLGPSLLSLEPPALLSQEPDEDDEEAHDAWEKQVWPYLVAYGSESLTDVKASRFVRGSLTDAVRQWRYQDAGVDAVVVGKINRSLNVQEFKVQEEEGVTKASGKQEFIFPLGFMILLWIAVMTSAGPLLNNTIEEKSNRILEVLVSSSTPFQILGGKILGNYLMGLTVTGIYAAAALSAAAYHDVMPSDGVSVLDLIYFVFYFLAGYLIYGCVYAAIGSVCMTIQEAQNMMAPLFLLMFLPMIAINHVIENPGSLVSQGLSYFPFSAPFVMMLRLGLSPQPPVSEILTSIGCMTLGVAFALWASSKVFRIAILIYGKPPSVKQLGKWVFQKS